MDIKPRWLISTNVNVIALLTALTNDLRADLRKDLGTVLSIKISICGERYKRYVEYYLPTKIHELISLIN